MLNLSLYKNPLESFRVHCHLEYHTSKLFLAALSFKIFGDLSIEQEKLVIDRIPVPFSTAWPAKDENRGAQLVKNPMDTIFKASICYQGLWIVWNKSQVISFLPNKEYLRYPIDKVRIHTALNRIETGVCSANRAANWLCGRLVDQDQVKSVTRKREDNLFSLETQLERSINANKSRRKE